MAVRVTQQLLFVGYTTAPEVRATAVVMEVIRSSAASAIVATARPTLIIIGN
jgi:DNA repair protein RadC